jgi:tetratricopeptide (TPR) repeat protein
METNNTEVVEKETPKSKQYIIWIALLLIPILIFFVMSKKNSGSADIADTLKSTAPAQAVQDPKVGALINASLEAYNQKDYQKCINLCDAAIAIDPNSYIAYSNKCSSLILLQQYDKAIEAGEKSVSINPNYNFGIGNLKWAKDEKAKAEAAKK